MPNDLETLFTEPKDFGFLIKAEDLVTGALLNKQGEGIVTVDILRPKTETKIHLVTNEKLVS